MMAQFGKFRSIVKALAVIVVLAGGAGAQEAFLPLADVQFSLEESQTDDFLRVIDQFAAAQRYTLQAGNFPKQGRTVVNLQLSISDRTFFTISNFREANSYELTAYSHEEARIWQDAWNRLISSLSAKFGPARVVPMQPH